MKKLVIIALVAVSGLDAKKHKMSAKMRDSGLVSLVDKAGNDVETMHVKNGDKLQLTSKELKVADQATQNINVGTQEVGGHFSIASFDNDILQVKKKSKGFEVMAVNDTDVPVTGTLIVTAQRMVKPSQHMGKTKRTGGKHIKFVVYPK